MAVTDVLFATVFGGLLLGFTVIGMMGIALLISIVISKAFPKFEPAVRRKLNWKAYEPATPQRRDLHHIIEAGSIRLPARTTFGERTVDLDNAFGTPIKSREPNTQGFMALRQPQTCFRCKRTRKLFHHETKLCIQCSDSAPVSAA